MQKNDYKVNLRELDFLLWEQLEIENSLFTLDTYSNLSKKSIQKRLTDARNFAYEKMGPAYAASRSRRLCTY